MQLYCAQSQGPHNSTPNKISKFPSEQFFAFKCGVCVPNLNSLVPKLWEEIEVTYGQTIPPTRCCFRIATFPIEREGSVNRHWSVFASDDACSEGERADCSLLQRGDCGMLIEDLVYLGEQ